MTKQYIYHIRDVDNKAFKIGISSNPEARLKALQTGNPSKLVLSEVREGTLGDERIEQGRYASSRLGGEWFRFYASGDELLVEGKSGVVACLILTERNGKAHWKTKFAVKPDETDRCIVAFDERGYPILRS